MDMFRRAMMVVFGLVLGIGLSIMVMIKGWGLEPKSWAWIIWISFFGQVFAQLLIRAAEPSKK